MIYTDCIIIKNITYIQKETLRRVESMFFIYLFLRLFSIHESVKVVQWDSSAITRSLKDPSLIESLQVVTSGGIRNQLLNRQPFIISQDF